MKNLGTLILGLILGAGAAYFYFNNFNQTQTMATPPSTTPSGIITAAQAKQLSYDWTALRKVANDSAQGGSGDNRSSWYSIEDLQYFIDTVTSKYKDADGIRFYLGVDKDAGDGEGLTTIFMVPTQPDERNSGHDDISGAEGLDRGLTGHPPTAAYPQ